ncbi:MAG: hypothetical protein JWQ23_2967, partial [Herminiimonas sp.]|nr:hypothetical protein [Herminiimonas sp.]
MPRQASEIIAILIEDHEKVLRLFTQFQK